MNARPSPFAIVFTVVLVCVFLVHARAPIGPGQDEHFHLMAAAIVGHHASDAFFRELYAPVSALDANTLLYFLAYPFEQKLDPVRAFQIAGTLAYFVGLPLATAHALRCRGRWVWPALLAVPLSHGRMWSAGGFWPFLSAAPLMILALAELPIALGHARDVGAKEGWQRQRVATVVTALAMSLCFLAHATAYVWTCALLSVVTLAAMRREGSRPRALRVAARALLLAAPSIVLAGAWFARTHIGAGRAPGGVDLTPIPRPWSAKLTEILLPFTQTRGEHEKELIAALLLVLFAALVFRRPGRERGYELAFGLTFLSYFVLPEKVGAGQSLASRQYEIALWLLPLVIAPTPPRVPTARHGLAAMITAYVLVRLGYVSLNLRAFQGELAGMRALATHCPEPRGRVAYVTSRLSSRYWDGFAMHQPHETFAALCRLDTPVYDSSTYPHSLQPLRYRHGLPAPIMILVDDRRWPARRELWESYDYVLVRGALTGPQLIEASMHADRRGIDDGWELWASRETRRAP